MLFLPFFPACRNTSSQLEIISSIAEGKGPSQHGLQAIARELELKGLSVHHEAKPSGEPRDYTILAGLSSDGSRVTKVLAERNVPLPDQKEGLVIRKVTFEGRPTLLLCGTDEVGLMYAALDVARRISWSEDPEDPFEYVVDVSESPDVQERAVSTGAFHRGYFEQRLHDPNYWEGYFDMMAENRLNQFLLIFGYKNNQYREPEFTAPVYPNFFNLDAFPYVKMSNLTVDQQRANSEALKRIIALAHERGIEFGVGLWDQIARNKEYRALVRDDIDAPVDLPANVIWGLSHKNLIPYTKEAMRKFFLTFPEIDLVQFRMHWESGISGEVALAFWKEIFNMLKEECPDIKIEARAKNVPDETLFDGADTGMDFRVTTKHWMEHMGQPFHPTHINKENQLDRRHGYADLLRYPKSYGFKWRVWTGGTTRILQWGDPDWVKRFAKGSHLYDAVGFEFNEPLYFKMNGSKHEAEVPDLLNPNFQYTTYEFERYWHYYQVMGRVSYNPDTPSDTWEMEFRHRFGDEAGPLLMAALHQASKVLPRIVSTSFLYSRFPSEMGWAELQSMGDLKHYAQNAGPTDIQQFASPQEEADRILSQEFSVRRQPTQTSAWFAEVSEHILLNVELADERIGEHRTKEYVSTVTDLKILAHLARFHAHRLQAAVQYNLHTETGDLVSFDRAIESESQAVAAYGRLVEAAGDVYASQLDFGSKPELFPGHWSKEYQRLQNELEALRMERESESTYEEPERFLAHVPVQRVLVGEPIVIAATVRPQDGVQSARVQFATEGGALMPIEMTSTRDGIYTAEIPAIGEEGMLEYYLEVTDTAGNTETLPETGFQTPIKVMVSDDREPPAVEMDRTTSGRLNEVVKVSARVMDASGVQNVALRYRRVSQFEDFQSVPMEFDPISGRYVAEVPASYSEGKYDVMYFVETMDTKGNGRMYPDMEIEKPYVIVHLER